ncbi:MAG: hypothetical protein MUD17_13925, partial [Gemmatimonadaceae bacterium]|nr:hypothetical protein [Gemmatimonadaceae bacterium]
VDYLAKHTPGAEPRLLRTSDNPRVVRDSIVSALRQSEAFQHSVLSMLAAHWRRDGRVIGGFDSQRPAMYVSEMDLRRVGARFFYMDRDERTGGLVTYVCVAKNGIGELPVKMDPVIEAFAFVAVNRAFVSADGRSPLMQAYERASARVQSARGRKGETNDVRHARRMMWAEMEQSPALAAAITDAFNEHASVLPFRLRAASR